VSLKAVVRRSDAFAILRPIRARKAGNGRKVSCSAAFGANYRRAVALTADRCSSQYPQLRNGSLGTAARAQLSSPIALMTLGRRHVLRGL